MWWCRTWRKMGTWATSELRSDHLCLKLSTHNRQGPIRYHHIWFSLHHFLLKMPKCRNLWRIPRGFSVSTWSRTWWKCMKWSIPLMCSHLSRIRKVLQKDKHWHSKAVFKLWTRSHSFMEFWLNSWKTTKCRKVWLSSLQKKKRRSQTFQREKM